VDSQTAIVRMAMNNQEANRKIIELIKKSIELTTGLEAEAPTAYLMTEIAVLKLAELLQSQSEPVAWKNPDDGHRCSAFAWHQSATHILPVFKHPPLSVNEQEVIHMGVDLGANDYSTLSIINNSTVTHVISGERVSEVLAFIDKVMAEQAITTKKAGE